MPAGEPRHDRVLRYVWHDLLHNPRRTLASVAGVALGVALGSGLLFFMDGSGATMTERAVAPLSLDMQRVLPSTAGGGLRLTERLAATGKLDSGQEATIALTAINDGVAPANEVVVSDALPPPLAYVSQSTTVDGKPVPDVGGESPLAHGLAGFGMNIGTLRPGATARISYVARAVQPVEEVASLPLRGTISSREQAEPIPANAPRAPTPAELQERVEALPGVAAADWVAFVDLPPGSLASDGSVIRHPIRAFAFDRRYQELYPSIRLIAGDFRPASAILSAEAAGTLDAKLGATVELRLPGRSPSLSLPVSGVADLSRARPLFASRKSTKLEQFLYVPDAIVVTPETFRDAIIPAFGEAQASVGRIVKSLPVQELDIVVDRSRLEADPGTALDQTRRIAGLIEGIAPQQGYLIDNISNALAVARADAATGKRMFLFLGIPGVLMAAVLAAYAGTIMAAAQRRELAILRVRGAQGSHLRRLAACKALAIAGAGSVLGIVLGLGSAATTLGWSSFAKADPADLAVSGVIAVAAGAGVTTLALYLPARRSVRRDVNQERSEMQAPQAPLWRRMWLDVALLGIAAIAEVVAVRTGALTPATGSVYAGVAIALPSRLLIAPIIAWVGGVLLCVRLFMAIASRLPVRPTVRFGRVVSGILSRRLRRESWSFAAGIIGLGLVVGFGASLAIFAATYDVAKAADSRFVVGSDLRITPSVLGSHPTAGYASELTVSGVSTVSPVVFGLENSLMIGPYNQDARNLAGIDPSSFARTAPLPDSMFVDRSAADTLAALHAHRRGVLVDAETADDLQVEAGDPARIVLALGTKREIEQRFRVLGLFDRFPGFPEGANIVMNLAEYRDLTGSDRIDFFLADVTHAGPRGMARAIDALRSGPGQTDPIEIESARTALDRDQSSLTALNVNGLVRLNALYVFLLSAATIAIFVFGLLLQRRREYVALRALGARLPEVHALIMAEAALVGACGLAAGLLVGTGMALLLVQVLRALFILDASVTFPVGRIGILAGLAMAATLASGLAAGEIVRRLRPTEILREE
jgi:putative ABC transport system permease protein